MLTTTVHMPGGYALTGDGFGPGPRLGRETEVTDATTAKTMGTAGAGTTDAATADITGSPRPRSQTP
ncbi:hypothetical protein GCM10022252_54960 [Streptosporangium oxazolinicum]|uniref:Uncharacterized protein n=1 Tax=Streptosporangium oxazolinicum TaxID=909287 RepID=A0ABP8B8X6_9ACTN